MIKALVGILLVAAVSTAGDYVWYEIGVEHRVITGVLHGAVLLMSVGGVVGAVAGRLVPGLAVGALSGIGGALAYYGFSLLPVGGAMSRGGGGAMAMLVGWTVVWLLIAIGEGRLLRTPRRAWGDSLVRGVIAAIGSGIAFYAVLWLLWGRAPAGGRNYLLQFAAWTIAWAPGILALTAGRKR